MKHLKLFSTDSEYQRFAEEEMVLPNVSYVEDIDAVYYNPYSATSQYIMVDLGLPSGLLWADRNVGASSPEDAGLYFAWGETVGYTAEQVANGEKKFNCDYYFDTTDGGSTFNKYATDKLTTLQPEDDAATVNMGSKYRMPTGEDINEIINNCTIKFIDLNGNAFTKEEVTNNISENNLKGIQIIGTNENSIFIPAGGSIENDGNYNYNSECHLWSSDIYFMSSYAHSLYGKWVGMFLKYSKARDWGLNIRGVQSK